MKVSNISLLGALPVAAAGIAILAASPSQAAIVGARGVNDPLAPAPTYWVKGSDQVDLYPDSYFQNSTLNLSARTANLISDRLGGFNEKQSIQLNTDIWPNIDIYNWTNNPQHWDQVSPNKIPSNTLISSHYFWLMPPRVPPPVFRTYVTVQIEFNEEIIGIIGGGPQLVQTDSLLGINNVAYNPVGAALDTRYYGQIPTLDPANDVVRSINGRFLTIYVNSANGLDTFRVITRADAVPEPLTILGAATATGFGAFFKRELAKRKKKDDA